jgi:hypothetical protein
MVERVQCTCEHLVLKVLAPLAVDMMFILVKEK